MSNKDSARLAILLAILSRQVADGKPMTAMQIGQHFEANLERIHLAGDAEMGNAMDGSRLGSIRTFLEYAVASNFVRTDAEELHYSLTKQGIIYLQSLLNRKIADMRTEVSQPQVATKA